MTEQCDFVSHVLSDDFGGPKENPCALLEFYNTQWRAYSASIQQLDLELGGVCELVNTIYRDLERDDDKEDVPFSIVKLGVVIWRYRVYKRNQKALTKACEVSAKQFLRQLKVEMMRRQRKAEDSSSEETSSDSESESEDEDLEVQIGFLKVQMPRKDLLRETIARFG